VALKYLYLAYLVDFFLSDKTGLFLIYYISNGRILCRVMLLNVTFNNNSVIVALSCIGGLVL